MPNWKTKGRSRTITRRVNNSVGQDRQILPARTAERGRTSLTDLTQMLVRCAADEIRHELDEVLLTKVLDIQDVGVLASMQTLREMLCAEPSIQGGKQSTCDLDAELEKLSAQGIVLPGMTAATSVRERR